MARFVFKLQALLDARHRAERTAQQALAGIEAERRALEEALRRQQARIDEARHALRGELTGTLHAQDLRMTANAALQLMRQAQRMLPDIAAVHQRLDEARQQLVEARRARRAVELLRERRLAEWRAAEARRETALHDDLASTAAARKETAP